MQVRSVFSESVTASTAGSVTAKLSNFSPNSLVFYIKLASAVSDTELSYYTVSVQFKNRLGKNAVILNNVPLNIIAKMSDFEGGFSTNSSNLEGAFRLDLGKVVLTGQDEISVSVSWTSSVASAAISCYAVDEKVMKEQILIYEYAIGSAGQQLTFPNAIVGYMAISSPSDALNVRTSDFFDDNLITEVQIVANGAVFGRAEDFDDFGVCWADKSGYTQTLGVTCGSSNEKVLVKEWFYDSMRLGVAQAEKNSVVTYANDIKSTNPEKYKCLEYLYLKK